MSAKPVRDDSAREVVVKTLESEGDVRYRAWIEQHREYVAERTQGRVGYIYVPSTGIDATRHGFSTYGSVPTGNMP